MSRTKTNSVRKPRASSAAEAPGAALRSPVKHRRCIVSRRECSTAHLIRFVAGPDNRIVPDLAERLPGRGLWLSANRATLDQARSSGSFSRAARAAVTLEEELAEQVGEQLAARALNYLGLSARAGAIAIGHDQVRADLSSKRAAVLVQAADGAASARARLRALANGLPAVEMFTRGELSHALGRADAVHVALRPSRLCDMFLRECGRLAGFRAVGESRLPAEKWDVDVGSPSAKQQNEIADRVGSE
ncbi:MAG: RNA-binding protein [Proteobacteria bacterium]|nr:RNA-binding protein [Pseudomonadota bacterium]MDA1355675.1 RNA-binding protein [Pseudomonadota bacterium]